MKLKSRRAIHSKEDNDYVIHSVAEPQHNDGRDKNEGESLELKGSDMTKDKDYYFMDTTLIGEIIKKCVKYVIEDYHKLFAAGERVKPIPVSEFSSHVERLHADRDKLFEMEYEVSGLYKQGTKTYPLGQLLFENF